jgi:signal peptidase I
MEPNYHDGEIGFFLKRFDSQNITVGSVIGYKFNSTFYISHRVVSKGLDHKGIFYITKGDNTNTTDPLVRPEQVKGILAFAQPIYIMPLELFSPAGVFFCSLTLLKRFKSKGGETKNV